MNKNCLYLAVLCVTSSIYLVAQAPEIEEQHRLHNDSITHIEKEVVEPEEQPTLFERINTMLGKATQSDQSSLYIFLLAFLAGILTSFTPCVYPMIPVTIGILQIQKSATLMNNFIAALTYVLGISAVYATLGYMSASMSLIFGQWVANPFVILFITLFFIYLAFSMFGFYEIYMPRFLTRSSGGNETRGSLVKIFFLGMVSGTVASPCLTPALAVLLALVAQVGNPLIGFMALFFFSLGMGVLLIIIGTFSGALSMLPRSGQWMDEVKIIMGFMLIAVAAYFAQPLLGNFIPFEFADHIQSIIYGIIALVAALYFLLSSKGNMLKVLIGLLCGLGGAWLMSTAVKAFMALQ